MNIHRYEYADITKELQ